MANILQRIRSKAARVLSDSSEWRVVRKTYRAQFGSTFIVKVDPRDEMLRYAREHNANPIRRYFEHGLSVLSDLEDVLRVAGRSYEQVPSLLEFACGYGRMTRFLIHRIDRHRITVSDINASAVDFTVQTFGVRGFCSVSDADELTCTDRYDVIFVVSLFSHLCLSVWEPWLVRLFELLTPRGHLVFSTHGMHAYNLLPPEAKVLNEQVAPGFWFSTFNETHGRLPTNYYGTSYVSDDYVRSVVASRCLGNLMGFYPARLVKFQDLYVIQKP